MHRETDGWKPHRGGGVVEEGAGGHAGRIPTCVPTPSPARRIDRRPEYRLTTVFAGFRLSPTLLSPQPGVCPAPLSGFFGRSCTLVVQPPARSAASSNTYALRYPGAIITPPPSPGSTVRAPVHPAAVASSYIRSPIDGIRSESF